VLAHMFVPLAAARARSILRRARNSNQSDPSHGARLFPCRKVTVTMCSLLVAQKIWGPGTAVSHPTSHRYQKYDLTVSYDKILVAMPPELRNAEAAADLDPSD